MKKRSTIKQSGKQALAAFESHRRDCLNEDDIKKIKVVLRKVWSWSHSRKLVAKRCDIGGGYSKCEGCKKKCPKIFVDHIMPLGTFDLGYIYRLFVSSKEMQGLCAPCHKAKTKLDMVAIKRNKEVNRREMVESEAVDYDFF